MAKLLSKFAKRIFNIFANDALYKDSRNIERWRQRRALEETGLFIETFMPLTPSFDGRYALMRFCARQVEVADIAGLCCEFGVAAGQSINYLARLLPKRTIFGFDSFEGLPEDWRDGRGKGTFKLSEPPKVARNVVLIPGWFDQSLPIFLKEHPEPVAFLHLDCDLYSSTRTVFEALRKRIQPGTIILFDEFFNYPGWKEGEHKAFSEFVKKERLPFEHIGYNRYGTQVAVRIRGR